MSETVPHDSAPAEAPLAVAPAPTSSITRISARTAVILLMFTLAFTALMAGIYQLTLPVLQQTAREKQGQDPVTSSLQEL